MGTMKKNKKKWTIAIVVLMFVLFLAGASAVHNMDEKVGNNPIETINEDRSQELVTGENYALSQEQEEEYKQNQQEQEERIEQQEQEEPEDVEFQPEIEEEESQQPEDEPQESTEPEDSDDIPDPGESGSGESESEESPSPPNSEEGGLVPGEGEAGPGDEDEGIDKSPSISVKGLEDQMGVEGTYFEFELSAANYKGEKLTDYSKIFIYLNDISDATRVSGRDETAFGRNYRVDNLLEGNNTIYIVVEDKEGNRASRQYTVVANTSGEVKVIGQMHIVINASDIGLGNLMDASEDIYKGDGVAHVVQRALTNNGFTYRHTGNASNTWYLAKIMRPGITNGFRIPDEIQAELDASGASTTGYDADSLGEKDFYEDSGWIYILNGQSPSTGMGTKLAEDGDEVIIRFILD